MIQLEAWHIPHPQPMATVLMFPGYSTAKSTILPEAKVLHDLGYAVFLVDFRGCGGSSGYQASIGYHEAEDVAHAVKYVRDVLPNAPIVLYSQSMGAAAILRAIAAYHIKPEAIIVEAVFDRMLSTVKNRFSAMGVPSFPGAHLLVFWGGVQRGFFGFHHNPAEYARRVQCPILMLHGEHDPRVTQQESQSVFDNLSGKKYYEIFKGIGHESYYHARPEQWQHVISEFLTEILAQESS